MVKNILVVGGAGYIGGFLVDQLNDANFNTTVYDNLLYEKQYFKDVEFINGDIRDTNKLINLIKIKKFDIIIWLAALVGDGACAINEKITYDINVNSLKDFIENYRGKIIFLSTCSVYGQSTHIIDEDGEKKPQSIYAKSKIEAEKIISKHDDFTIIRLGTLFGLGDKFSRIRLDLVVNLLTLKACKKEKISVYGGDQFRPLLHVKDVATGILHIIKNKINGIYNLSYMNFKILDLALSIKNRFDYPLDLAIQDLPFEDTRNYSVSNQRILDTGWKPKFKLEDGIDELKKIFIEERIKDTSDEVFSNAVFLKKIKYDSY